LQAIEKIVNSNNWMTLILVLLFVGIFFLKVLDAKRLKRIFIISFGNTSNDDEVSSKYSFTDSFQIVIFIFSATVLSLLIYNFKFLEYTTEKNFFNFLSFFFVLIMYLLVKNILEKSIVFVFLIRKNVQNFLKSKYKSFYAISFFLYILILFYEYGNLKLDYLIYFSIFLFGVHFTYVFTKNKKLIFSKLFYFILYICAFEIAPLFILFKLMF
jgi:hypothetical protein